MDRAALMLKLHCPSKREEKRCLEIGRERCGWDEASCFSLHGNRWKRSLSKGKFLWLCVWTFTAT